MSFSQSISIEEIEALELAAFEGPISVISQKDEQYAEAIDYLFSQEIIGFDTETKPSFQHGVPQNKMALLQLSGPDKSYLFRLPQLGLPMQIAKILSSNKIIKVGAAVRDDIRGLSTYRKFTPRNFVDLQLLGQQYGISDKSVRKMAAIILGVKISKTQQLSNWEAAQLSGAQLKYAATDAWICRQMYQKLCESEKVIIE